MLAMAEPIERLMLFCSLLRGISANYTRARRGVLLEIGRRSEDEVRREMHVRRQAVAARAPGAAPPVSASRFETLAAMARRAGVRS
jgi:hypothetical protein